MTDTQTTTGSPIARLIQRLDRLAAERPDVPYMLPFMAFLLLLPLNDLLPYNWRPLALAIRAPLEGSHAWYVLMEISSPREDARDTIEAILGQGMEDGIVEDAVIAANLDQRAAFWKLREVISPVQKFEGGSIKHDVSVPVASVPQFLTEADAAVVKLIPGARPFAFGHLGDGNIHYNVTQPVGADTEAYLDRWHDVNDVVHAVVAKYHGSISAEHGIGILKRDELPHVKDPVALAVMRSIKSVLDPLGILNPGKVL